MSHTLSIIICSYNIYVGQITRKGRSVSSTTIKLGSNVVLAGATYVVCSTSRHDQTPNNLQPAPSAQVAVNGDSESAGLIDFVLSGKLPPSEPQFLRGQNTIFPAYQQPGESPGRGRLEDSGLPPKGSQSRSPKPAIVVGTTGKVNAIKYHGSLHFLSECHWYELASADCPDRVEAGVN